MSYDQSNWGVRVETLRFQSCWRSQDGVLFGGSYSGQRTKTADWQSMNRAWSFSGWNAPLSNQMPEGPPLQFLPGCRETLPVAGESRLTPQQENPDNVQAHTEV